MFSKNLYAVRIKPTKTCRVCYENDYDNPRKNRVLLSCILTQAMRDGMTMIRIGIDPASSEAYMKYYGPDDNGNPQWWDMVPPPKEHYPYLLQYVISITSIDGSIPLKGKIRFLNRKKFLETEGKNLEINIDIPEHHTIQLSWPESFAKRHADSQQAEGGLGLEYSGIPLIVSYWQRQ